MPLYRVTLSDGRHVLVSTDGTAEDAKRHATEVENTRFAILARRGMELTPAYCLPVDAVEIGE
jgi:hypothetical protein